jgi:hypothetical protein
VVANDSDTADMGALHKHEASIIVKAFYSFLFCVNIASLKVVRAEHSPESSQFFTPERCSTPTYQSHSAGSSKGHARLALFEKGDVDLEEITAKDILKTRKLKIWEKLNMTNFVDLTK